MLPAVCFLSSMPKSFLHMSSLSGPVRSKGHKVQVVICMHCLQMADGAGALQDAVVRLCCLWWQKELPGKADMVPQMVPYLLYQATISGRVCCTYTSLVTHRGHALHKSLHSVTSSQSPSVDEGQDWPCMYQAHHEPVHTSISTYHITYHISLSIYVLSKLYVEMDHTNVRPYRQGLASSLSLC